MSQHDQPREYKPLKTKEAGKKVGKILVKNPLLEVELR
jgi:hypothetical protein